uniref:epididymal secretory protein E3-beta-like n=1 Tax=Jaculus jaculus TaxID=51337 RepID=UPI001E1B42C9|nr:epididymal secretory protein E3-beta-like [Jaculus jaculus]
MPMLNEVALVTRMASSPKAWGTLVVLLCLQHRPLVQSKYTSRREFMDKHHLSPTHEFSAYKCTVLMSEKDLQAEVSHLFIYISWYKVEHICVSGNWKDRYKNSYVWAQTPIKVLECHWDSFKNSYMESRSYSYVQFHCNMDGYVDDIEDMKIIETIVY